MVLSPADVMKEMKTQGMDTAQLFNKSAQVLDPQQLANEEAIARAKAEGEASVVAEVKLEKPTIEPRFFEEPNKETPPAESQVATAEVSEDEPLDPTSENFKRLRGAHKETKKALKELEAKYKENEEKFKSYVPQETLAEREAKIAELSKYEKIHNLKASSEYKEKYIKPLNQQHQKLKEILKDYGVPEEALSSVVKEAVSLTNHADLNSFLSDHFHDQLGANEAKALIGNIRNIENDARSAEAEPQKALESLQESTAQMQQQMEVDRRNKVSRTAKSAWEEVMLEIRQEGQVKELIPVDDDPEFNENYAYKLQKQAAIEYGKVITEMAKDGATPSREVAKALAKMTALSQVAGVSIHTRNRAMQHAEEVSRNAERESGFYRPNIGGGNGSHAPADQGEPKRAVDPNAQLKADTAGLLNSILSKR